MLNGENEPLILKIEKWLILQPSYNPTTMLNQVSNKKLSDFPKLYRQTKDYLREHKRFSICFSTGFWGVRKKQTCRTILDPLIPSIELVVIYDLQEKNKKVQKFKSHLVKKNGRHILDMSGKKWEHFLPLLYTSNIFSTIDDVRGSILIRCMNRKISWEKVFKNSFGPVIFSNPSVGCGKAALNYAKRNLDNQNVFVIIEKLNSGLESITITCNTDTICSLFDTAMENCHLSSMRAEENNLIEKHLKS